MFHKKRRGRGLSTDVWRGLFGWRETGFELLGFRLSAQLSKQGGVVLQNSLRVGMLGPKRFLSDASARS
jgi:hypothetical protein